jgi:hypothetical protein
LLADVLGINPVFSLPVGGITAWAAARMIGEEAIRLYSGPAKELTPAPST